MNDKQKRDLAIMLKYGAKGSVSRLLYDIEQKIYRTPLRIIEELEYLEMLARYTWSPLSDNTKAMIVFNTMAVVMLTTVLILNS